MRSGQSTLARSEELKLRVGDIVVVRSAEEILATLDDNGELDSLPFMPEMLQFCGKRMTVYKVAHKLCDTIARTGMRRMERAVHLVGSRCDGSAHGGCQTGCLLYWKEAWLKRVDSPETDVAVKASSRIDLPLLEMRTRRTTASGEEERYSCQATELLRAAPESLPFRDLRQYAVDVRTGNASVREVLVAVLVGAFNKLQSVSQKVLPPRLWFRGGARWRFIRGHVVGRTPTAETGLQPGDLVRIKSRDEIIATIDKNLLNRGLGFEEEMERYCGQERRVLRRVDRCIDEATGRMLKMKYPCIVLEETIFCTGGYTASCPRAFLPFWREIWLERVDETPA